MIDDWDIKDMIIRSKHLGRINKGQDKSNKPANISDKIEIITDDIYYENQIPNFTIKNYIDQVFPANLESLIYIDPTHDESDVTEEEKDSLKSFKWKRAREIFRKDNFTLYEKIEVDDINQGQIGNCYFLSALSSLAEFDNRYDNIFINKVKSENGCYAVRLLIEGIPHIVSIDDYFPSYQSLFAGATSGRGELWVQVLEKAWAKINKSYAGTIAGLPSEALSCLTNAPCISYIHRKYAGDRKDEIWKILNKSDVSNYILCTNTGNNKDAEAMGLVRSHAYSIISVFEFPKLRLVKLRNPWGKFEWKGDYSDKSESWKLYEDLKNKVGFKDSDDGDFFMTFDDFLKYFPYTFVCKYESGFHYRFVRVYQENVNQMTCTKITIKQNTNITITLHQKQKRFFNKVNNYSPQRSRIILGKCFRGQTLNYKYVSSSAGDNDKQHIQIDNLEPGEYHIFANVNWNFNAECCYTISTYASSPVEVEQVFSGEIPTDYLEILLSSYLAQHSSSIKSESNYNYHASLGDNDTGYALIKYENKSPISNMEVYGSGIFNDKCQFIENPKVKYGKSLSSNDANSHDFSFIIPPNSSQLLIFKLNDNLWNCQIQVKKPKIHFSEIETLDYGEKYRSIIAEKMSSLNKQSYSIDGYYSELEVEDGVLLVIFNKSQYGQVHKFKIIYEKLINLQVVSPLNGYLAVSSGSYEFVYLQKLRLNEDYDFVFRLSFKK